MTNLDEIMDMLDWNNSQEVQEKGVALGAAVNDLRAFLQPTTARHDKNVWDNCALILAQNPDKELTPYLPALLEWLQDLNWPGVFTIMDRLKTFSGEILLPYFLQAVEQTSNLPEDDNTWMDNLSLLLENDELATILELSLYHAIRRRYQEFRGS